MPWMFFLKELIKEVFLVPELLTPGISALLKQEAVRSVEGKCIGKHGYVIAVVDIKEISRGIVQDTTGDVCFRITYTALFVKPFKNEVVDGIVTQVNKIGVFCEIGPVPVFISSLQMPEDFSFDSSVVPVFQNVSQSIKIEKDDNVRLKIIGTRITSKGITAVGSIKDDYLGLL